MVDMTDKNVDTLMEAIEKSATVQEKVAVYGFFISNLGTVPDARSEEVKSFLATQLPAKLIERIQ